MKNTLLIILLLITSVLSAQDDILAKEYFDKGEFEKALISYQKLLEEKPGNHDYFFKILEINHQLENYDIVRELLTNKVSKSKNPQYLVELGYNYQLNGEQEKAKELYNQAILKIEENPVYTYYVANRFESHALIDYAATAYEKGMALNPKLNYNIQLARIYGEQGKVEKMFNAYLTYLETNKTYNPYIQRSISEYITEDGTNQNNIKLKRVLLKKMQTKPNLLWNQFLSWLYVQQKDYDKAFTQEKAIYKREQLTLEGILDLATLTIEANQNDVAHEILDYIIEHAITPETLISAHKDKLELQLKQASTKDYKTIEEKYNNLLENFGRIPATVDLQLSYANFIAFYLNKPEAAISFLKESLNDKFNRFSQAKIKLKLGDILIFQERFNEALIYYTQIQANLKNSTLSQQARFRVAKASYYKGDFDWAESQLKILKSSTSQLIANDALDLKLLISDNKFEDSTQTALRQYAKADLMAYQKKTDKAISLLETVLENHKTETIVDQALFLQAKLFEEKKQYLKAEANYQKIIANYKDDILIDDAYYALAELYNSVLNNPDRAKYLYEQIIFNHADSIYFVEARKKYRMLRGDDIN
ncbi:MAG: tetratricopeptide repeat protein [Flavobacteriaceae bacterium]|nr:tetratricopeptide repeat protein [Flavobacteriaceae bacterium]